MTDLSAGSQLGRYELLIRIGHGGMASVWVARLRSDSGQDRLVAIKAMLPELARDSAFRAMFLDEVQIVRSIDHENVVRVYEVSEDQGVLYMVMEWVEGDSLRNLIRQAKRRAAIPSEIAVRIVADTAAGLHAAHELRGWDGELRQVVHCDVSPHNILVGVNGQAKVVDFGIANAMGTLDSEGLVRGKLGYMSPEQAAGQHLDRRSDVFSLGVVLYELATGEQLFKGRDADHTLALIKYAQIPSPSRVNAAFPLALESIVMRSLERDPDSRFQTALKFREALESYLAAERVLVSRAAVGQLLHKVVGERIHKRREVLEAVAYALDNERGLGMSTLQGVRTEPWARESSTDISRASTSSRSNSALGIAAKLHDTGVATSLVRHSDSVPGWRPRLWPSVALGVAALGVGSLWYLRVSTDSGPPLDASSTVPQTPDTAETFRARGSPPQAPKEEKTIFSLDALPAASEARSTPPSQLGGAAANRPAPELVRLEASAPSDSAHHPALGRSVTPQSANSPVAARTAEGATPEAEVVVLTPSSSDAASGSASRPRVSAFDRSAASTALANAASTAQNCGGQASPSGSGTATVTFRPDGAVSGVSVSQRFVGTSSGNCVVRRFQSVRVPAFSGLPVTMSQGFRILE